MGPSPFHRELATSLCTPDACLSVRQGCITVFLVERIKSCSHKILAGSRKQARRMLTEKDVFWSCSVVTLASVRLLVIVVQ